jgi:predicted Rossmann-fold nucleotide-binding protein
VWCAALAEQSIYITTGGGPGFMEAANQGAASVPGALTIGMGITLPFEDGLNPFVSEELAFEFHYFFTRKFWMVYHCQVRPVLHTHSAHTITSLLLVQPPHPLFKNVRRRWW